MDEEIMTNNEIAIKGERIRNEYLWGVFPIAPNKRERGSLPVGCKWQSQYLGLCRRPLQFCILGSL